MILRATGAIACAYLLIAAGPAEARLTKFIADGSTVSGLLPGETIRGHFEGELDPEDPHNAVITDIKLAPKNARGRVEYSATFTIFKPLDMTRSNGVLYYSVPNRGNGSVASFPDGRVSVVSGWQGDVIPRANLQTITVPVVKGITGPVVERLINAPAGTTTIALNTAQYVALTYQKPATLDTSKAWLKHAGKKVPSKDWAFADCAMKPFPGTPDPSRICVRGGFEANSEYVVQYTATDPLVLGVGFAATRDLNSFLRYADKDDFNNSNPVAKQIRYAVAQGNSQSGNFIRSFINLGFNQDEANRIVWDGVNPHIAARQLALNIRFGLPGAAAGMYEPGSEGVLWWAEHQGMPGLLGRCQTTGTCPKILETFGELEFWYLRESPNLVGKDGKADIPLPANVRRYYFPGTTHGGGRGGFTTAAPAPTNGCVLPANPNPESDTMRALDRALIDWVTKGKEPPASRYPHLVDLVPAALANPIFDYDFGADFNYRDESGIITKEPPTIRRVIPVLVPKADAEGVPSVLYSAPLGTYLGWNTVAGGFDKGKICGLNGGYKPFDGATLLKRYGTHEGYVEAVKKAAEEAVKERFLLQEDADRLIAEAAASGVLN